MPHLHVENVVKKFGDFTAVDGVSFAAEQGEFITLLGPSGCGKTTLLKSIGGFFEDLTSGTISIGGVVVNNIPPEKRDTAMCFQSYALFPHLTVFKNVSFGLEQKKVERNTINEQVSAVLEQVDLSNQIAKLPNELSGGQQQRVALARAMAVRPGVILFDEPLSNLDAKLRERVRFEIRQLQKEMGYTAVYVTHDQQEALAISDRIIVMNRGKVQQEGSPRAIYNYPANKFVADFIGTANIMKAKIREAKGKKYRIETELGNFTAIIEHEQANTPQSDKVYVGWRPESVEIYSGKRDDALNLVNACVQQVAFLGTCVHVFAYSIHKTTGIRTDFYIEAPESFDVQQGTEFQFSIKPEKIFFLERYDE